MEDAAWFARFADLPGVGYAGHPSIDRRTLPQHDAKPEVQTFSYDGKPQGSLFWKAPPGGSSQSPASAWAPHPDPRTATADALRRLYEALELPGQPTDYHFALLGGYELLWTRRRKEPDILPELERLCLLDIRLVEKFQAIILGMIPGQQFAARVPAFHYLVYLYSREGFLDEALTIAKLGAQLGQGDSDLREIEKRIADIEIENDA